MRNISIGNEFSRQNFIESCKTCDFSIFSLLKLTEINIGTVFYLSVLTMFTDVFAFEIAGVILLVAIVAAVALTLRRRKDHKTQDIGSQIRTQASDRLRIVSMASENQNRQIEKNK